MSDRREHTFRDVIVGILTIVVGAAVISFSALPTRVSLVEQSQTETKKIVEKIDAKLDILLLRREQ